MALFDGSIFRAIRDTVVPVAAGFLGSRLGAAQAPPATTTPVAGVAMAAPGVQPSGLESEAATGTPAFLRGDIFGIPKIIAIPIIGITAWLAIQKLK